MTASRRPAFPISLQRWACPSVPHTVLFRVWNLKDGYVLDDQAYNAGLRGVAAPIYLGGNKLLFAMSISAPAARMDDAAYENARKLVLKYADLISQEIQSIEFCF